MVQRDDLWRPEQYAVFDVDSDVGHGLLPFYVDVLRGRPYLPHTRHDGVLYPIKPPKAEFVIFFQKKSLWDRLLDSLAYGSQIRSPETCQLLLEHGRKEQ